jgi:CheY-like chemotaxis protein
MSRAVARGTGLTRHLLAFSRRRPVNPESIDLALHLAGMREMLARALGGNIHFEMRFGADLWPVEVDAGELELAMLNLCVNARDAMGGGGTITIAAHNERGAAGDDAVELVRLSVADSGSGMTPEVLSRVFEPFFTTKDIGKGSGLGLPQVYGFVKQSGGRIELHSRVGAGTEVVLHLPRSRHAPVAQRAAGSAHPARHDGAAWRGEVLLVEDDGEVAALTSEMLKVLGFNVIHVGSPEAALGALANGRAVDIVLSDIMMPGGVGGLELAREIRRRKPGLPIVLVTGFAEAAAGLEDGHFGLLLKPYSVESLAAALDGQIR